MDAFVAFGDYGFDAQQARAFGGPVAGGAGAVFLAGQDYQGNAIGLIFLGGFEDRHFLVGWEVAGESAFDVDQFVAQADVGESSADHYLVVAAAGAVGVEVGGVAPGLLQVFSSGAVFLDGASGRDVVGGDAVAEHG